MELEQRVAAMAARIGQDAPPLNRIEGSERQPCAFTVPPGSVGPALVVHNHLEDKPERLQDFLIAQALVSDRLGVNQGYARLVWGIRIAIVVLVGVLTSVYFAVVDGLTWQILFWPPLMFVTVLAAGILPVAIWSRAFVRRVDDRLIQLFGRDELIDLLRRDVADRPRPVSWFWIRTGLRPRSVDRLRRLT